MRVLGILVTFFSCMVAVGEEIRVLSWNVESGGNNANTISTNLSALNDGGRYDLICLTEVRSNNAHQYEQALEDSGVEYTSVVSASGGSDRIMLLFRTSRFERLDSPSSPNRPTELVSQDGMTFPGGNNRRPSLVQLRDNENNGLVFNFMGNHLNRGTDQTRQRQALLLREWAEDNGEMPTIALGDYNFDFEFNNLTGNQSMSIFLREDASDGGEFIWKWLIPDTAIEVTGTQGNRVTNITGEFRDTNWADLNGNGEDNFPDSFLDFAFVTGPAKNWASVATVIIRDNDFPDDDQTSDHRPIEVVLTPTTTVIAGSREANPAVVSPQSIQPNVPNQNNQAASGDLSRSGLQQIRSGLQQINRATNSRSNSSIIVGEPDSRGNRIILVINPETNALNSIEIDRFGTLRKLSSVQLD